MARGAVLAGPVRVMKDVHVRLELEREAQTGNGSRGPTSTIRAVGWNLAARAGELGLGPGSRVDLAYRIRENHDPDFAGVEAEILGMESSAS